MLPVEATAEKLNKQTRKQIKLTRKRCGALSWQWISALCKTVAWIYVTMKCNSNCHPSLKTAVTSHLWIALEKD